MDRTFHQRFTIAAKSGITVFTLLSFWFFWNRQAAIGILVAIIVVGMVERVLNTTYTFRRIKPIDMDEEKEFLIINKGRFSANRNIPVDMIKKVTSMKTAFGLSHYLLIEYGNNNMEGVLPEDDDAFMRELKKRQNEE